MEEETKEIVKSKPQKFWHFIRHFFPVLLLLLHFKKNHFLLFLWVILFGIVANVFASRYGVGYLFLAPEYQGEQNWLAFAILGFSFGGFFLAFHLYTYVMFGYLFPFIATMERPFSKFSANNLLLPTIFLIVYLIFSFRFQVYAELIEPSIAFLNLFSLMVGVFLFKVISTLYFITTNRTVKSFSKRKDAKGMVSSMLSKISDWSFRRIAGAEEWKVETYLSTFFKPRLARSIDHYDRVMLQGIFAQHHINASIFEIVAVVSFIIIGSFGEYSIFAIPAAASGVLLLTTLVMVYSALYSWFKGWTATLVVFIVLLINYTSTFWGPLKVESRAYGLNYSIGNVTYNPNVLMSDTLSIQQDFLHGLEILENWRRSNTSLVEGNMNKPKLLVLNVSGGGLRSALWTLACMSKLDSISDGKIMHQTHLITGSSGGIIGAAYFRELFSISLQNPDSIYLYDEIYRDNISSDILNPMIFSAATNDVFIRYQKFRLDDEIYTKDRGYAFERELNLNTGYIFRERISDYKDDEFSARIPLLIMAPTIVNDGRRMLISAQPLGFMRGSELMQSESLNLVEDIEFSKLFKNHSPEQLRTTSALRMNATFPYIMPAVDLPTDPSIELLDAGLRDNFGAKTTAEYLFAFRNWIATNTSGVVLVRIRDTPRQNPVQSLDPSLIGRFTAPLGSVYGNVTRTQDMNNERLLFYLRNAVDYPIDIIDMQLEFSEEEHISLSWHLTRSERQRIQRSLDSKLNQAAAGKLMKLIGN